MLVLMLPHVSSRVSGFPVASPCLWGKLQSLSFSKVSIVMSFCVAGAGTLWHSNLFDNVSKIVLCGRRNTFASFSQDKLQFSWQARHFGDLCRHFAWQAQHFRRVTLRALHSTLYTPHSTLYTSHSTLYIPHFTLHTLHFTLHTLHSTLYTWYFTHHTLHSTLYTLHSTLHTLHFINVALQTLYFSLHIGHSFTSMIFPYLRVSESVPLSYVWAFGFMGCILFSNILWGFP